MACSYSSSSFGPHGSAYRTNSTMRVGPNGVRELVHTVSDGQTDTITLERGIGNRVHLGFLCPVCDDVMAVASSDEDKGSTRKGRG